MLPGLCTTQSKPKCISASLFVGLIEFLLVSVFYGILYEPQFHIFSLFTEKN